MTPSELDALVAGDESETVEFKASVARRNDIVESLVAMANRSGGCVLIGVSDDKQIVGVTLGKGTLEGLSNDIKRDTEPAIIPSIEVVRIRDKTVVVVSVDAAPPGVVFHAYGRALLRSGRTNQPMPGYEQGRRYMAPHRPAVMAGPPVATAGSSAWHAAEKRRIARYEANRGLFLVHRWRPSTVPGQFADIQIELHQHGPGPLTMGTVRDVRYHLGPRFSPRDIIRRSARRRFRLEVSAYAPFLCTAVVRFTDGHEPIELERYVDFE